MMERRCGTQRCLVADDRPEKVAVEAVDLPERLLVGCGADDLLAGRARYGPISTANCLGCSMLHRAGAAGCKSNAARFDFGPSGQNFWSAVAG